MANNDLFLQVRLSQLNVETDFNARTMEGDEWQEGIQALAESIMEDGLQQPLIVRTRGKTSPTAKTADFMIRAGHRRYAALARIKMTNPEWFGTGEDERRIPVIVRSGKAAEPENMKADLALMLADLQSMALTPVEAARKIQPLRNLGSTDEQIRRALGGITAQTLLNWERLMQATEGTLALVEEGVVAPTPVFGLVGEHGAERTEVIIKAALETAHAEGRERVTGEDLKEAAADPALEPALEAAGPKPVRRAAPRPSTAVRSRGKPGARPRATPAPRATEDTAIREDKGHPYNGLLKRGLAHLDSLMAGLGNGDPGRLHDGLIGLSRWYRSVYYNAAFLAPRAPLVDLSGHTVSEADALVGNAFLPNGILCFVKLPAKAPAPESEAPSVKEAAAPLSGPPQGTPPDRTAIRAAKAAAAKAAAAKPVTEKRGAKQKQIAI